MRTAAGYRVGIVTCVIEDARQTRAEAGPPEVPGAVRTAAGLVALEALALLAAAAILLAKTATGHPSSLARALLDAAFALCGAALLVLAARGLVRLRPAARTPVVVLQILALPVAYTLAFQAHRVEYGGPILVAALATLYLLFTPPARAALDRHLDR
jgi:crotonobetainyl-CoA:carnitine CoA-transferase CaiB-like acyl-CoA transferase